MEDSEKLTALKKAYADIILNTAKEAAARIMVSERKATRFQQELVSTKEEALRMLLRLKQMFDSKVNEAELTSLSQQKKIEELEAQLQEAEEIVRDLRAELRETQAELENVTKHQMHPPVEQNIEGEIPAQENLQQQNRLDPYAGSVYCAPDVQLRSVSISDPRNPNVNGTNDSSKFCVSHDHTTNCDIHNPDFASIVIRRKEPELYRNGCTQRIRAFERSLFDGNVSMSGNIDDERGETLVSADEGKAMTVTTNDKADIICEKEKPDEVKVMKADSDSDLVKVPVPRNKRRFRKRKALRSRLHSDQVKETNKESYQSGAEDSSRVLDNNPSRMSSSITNGNQAQQDLISPSANDKADIICEKDKPDEVKVTKADSDSDLVKVPVRRNKRRFRKRKALRSRLHSDQVKETNKESYQSGAEDSPRVLDNNDPSRMSSSITNGNQAQQDLISPSANDKADIICEKDKPDEVKVTKADSDSDLVKVPVRRNNRRFRKRKALRSRLHSDQVKETNKESYQSGAEDSPCVLDNNDPSRMSSSITNGNQAQQDLVSPSANEPTEATPTIDQSGSHTDTENGEVFLKACSAGSIIKVDKEPLDKSDLTTQVSLSPESLEVPACKDVEAANGSPDKMDAKVSDLDEKVSTGSVNGRFLKTFTRKRKKESVSGNDVECSQDNSSLKKKCVETQSGHVEPQKSCTMTESSRDSRRLAQVARQLISLSEKKWWQ